MRTYWVPPVTVLSSLGPLLSTGPSNEESYRSSIGAMAQNVLGRGVKEYAL